ncbi:MAG TPA: ABC transporter permease [Acidobacteriota bacterium]|nr:ABC transporter permease [Acidobacteriota bacterium]
MKPILPSGFVRRVLSVTRKEVRQLSRDRLTMGFVVFVPLVQLILFGYAINQDVRQVSTAVVDACNSEVSRRILGRLQATQTFRITHYARGEEEARSLLRRGDVRAAVLIPPDFDRRYRRGRGAQIAILVDASDPVLARSVRTSANGLSDRIEHEIQLFEVNPGQSGALRASRNRGRFGLEPELVRERPVAFVVLSFFNPQLRTAVFVVPGLLGVILTTTMILMTALALVRERERGTFEFLIATPLQRSELMIGKILPYVVIGILQILIILAAGLVIFAVPMEGSLLDLLLASFFFILANLTLGLVISSVTESQLQATQLSFFFFLPSVLLSGFMFPFEAMPEPAQWLGELLPLTHFIRLSRGIMLRGAPLWTQPLEVFWLLAFFAAGLAASVRLFRKRLD